MTRSDDKERRSIADRWADDDAVEVTTASEKPTKGEPLEE